MDKYEIIYIYEYDKNTKLFSLSKIECAKNSVFLTGEKTGEDISESLIPSRKCLYGNEKKLVTEISSIKKGFYIKEKVDIERSNSYDNLKKEAINNLFTSYETNFISDSPEDEIEIELIKTNSEKVQIDKTEHSSYVEKKVTEIYTTILNDTMKEEAIRSLSATSYKKVNVEKNHIIDKQYEITNRYNIEEIKNYLKEKIVAQDNAIESLVPGLVWNQVVALASSRDISRTEKRVFLVEAPTSVGKTLLFEELAEYLDIPIVIKAVTNYSAVGYKGDGLSSILKELLNLSAGDYEKARKGIIVLDEIDKLANHEALEMRDAIEEELLSWINGTTITINEDSKHSMTFNTKDNTFVVIGAFTELREEEKQIGFNIDEKEEKPLTKERLIKYGLKPEFVSRLNIILSLKKLTVEDFINLLTNKKLSPLKNFVLTASMFNVNVYYTEEFVRLLSEEAYKLDLGARGLIGLFQEIETRYIEDIINGNIKSIYLDETLFKNAKQEENKKTLKL